MPQLFFGVFVALILMIPQSAWVACGEVLVSKGDVKIESAKGKASPATQGSKVCQGDTIVAGTQSRAKVKMEDGNELNISPESRIKIETYEYKPADNKKKVMLNVLYGKVRAATREENMYVDKAKDGQANTFQVKTKSAVAGVRGTDFLTSFDRKTSKTEVITFKGLVEVGAAGPNGAILNPVQVGAGQKTEKTPGAPPAPPKTIPAKEIETVSQDTGGAQASNAPAPTAATSGTVATNPPAPAPSETSMVTKDDLATTPTRGPAGTTTPGPTTPVVPTAPPIVPKVPITIPNADLVREVQQTGPGKVNIKILIPQ